MAKMSGSIFVATLAICASSSAAWCQATARQGATVDQFQSPMILELALPDMSGWERGTIRYLSSQVDKFYCEDVAIAVLSVAPGKAPKNSPGAVIELRGSLYVRPSHDRRVDLQFWIVSGDEVLARAYHANLDAEEKKHTPFKADLLVSKAKLAEARARGEAPVLRITVTVRP